MTYLEFLKEIIGKDYAQYSKEDIDKIGATSHGLDRDSFRDAYESSHFPGVEIYHLDNPKTLRIGFVVDWGEHQIWHTIRIQAWRAGDKSDPSYKFDFHESLREYILKKEKKEIQNKPMTIKEGWFCYGANFDCKEPHIIIADNDCNKEEKILIPETVAYYLRTHFCGSNQMRDTIRDNAISDMQYKFKELLGIK
jgi:hypothetical protein